MSKAAPVQHQEDASYPIVRHFLSTTYTDLPADIVETVKKSVLDTLGVCLAATTLAQGCREIAGLVMEAGGKEESTLLGFGRGAPAWLAAWVNGALANGLDYDDLHHEGISHPSGPLVPAAFAAAERVGRVSGKEFITAVALGHDMLMRMTSALPTNLLLYHWMRFPVIGVFAAAATAGKLLGLDSKKMHDAIGIALCYSAGAEELLHSMLRGLHYGYAAKGGVLSAMMAERGITGPEQPLEGLNGFFNVYYEGKYDRNLLLGNLGKQFHGAYLGYKYWPTCSVTHTGIDATLRLMEEHNIDHSDIEGITVSVGTQAKYNCEPLEVVQKPQTITDAKFSIPFTVALAATRRRVTLADFTLDRIKDPAMLDLASRVTPVIDPKLNVQRGVPLAIVEMRMKDGNIYSARTEYVYGHYRNPMDMEAIIRKFRECVSYSARTLPPADIEKTIEMVRNLEKVPDVSEITGRLG